VRELVDADRFAQQLALEAIAAAAQQELALFVLLAPFGDNLQAEFRGQGDDRLDDRGRVRIDMDVAHEGLVNFERREREALQVAERSVAGSEGRRSKSSLRQA
jgi:hypothetical protein